MIIAADEGEIPKEINQSGSCIEIGVIISNLINAFDPIDEGGVIKVNKLIKTAPCDEEGVVIDSEINQSGPCGDSGMIKADKKSSPLDHGGVFRANEINQFNQPDLSQESRDIKVGHIFYLMKELIN